jgi:hypothetical protein
MHRPPRPSRLGGADHDRPKRPVPRESRRSRCGPFMRRQHRHLAQPTLVQGIDALLHPRRPLSRTQQQEAPRPDSRWPRRSVGARRSNPCGSVAATAARPHGECGGASPRRCCRTRWSSCRRRACALRPRRRPARCAQRCRSRAHRCAGSARRCRSLERRASRRRAPRRARRESYARGRPAASGVLAVFAAVVAVDRADVGGDRGTRRVEVVPDFTQ